MGIAVLAVLLRIESMHSFWINPDEGIYLEAANSETSVFWELIRSNAHPPLYYLLVRAGSALGVGFVPLRWFTLLCFGALIFAMYRWLSKSLNPGTGLIAASLVALSPGAAMTGQVLRPYMLQLLLLVLGCTALVAFTKHGRRTHLWGYSLAFSLALLTHYSSVFVFTAVVFGQCVSLRTSAGRRDHRLRAILLANLLPAAVISGLVWWHLSDLDGGALQAQALLSDWRHLLLADLSQAPLHLAGVLRFDFGSFEGPAILLLGAGLLVAALRRQHWYYGIPLGLLVLAITAARLEKYPFGVTRHSLYLLPFLVAPMALAVSRGLSRGPYTALTTLVLVSAGLVFAAPINSRLGTTRYVHQVNQELTMQAASVRILDPAIQRAQQYGLPLVMDLQNYYYLVPIFQGSERGRRTDPEYPGVIHFTWGNSPVLVRQSWIFANPEDFDGFLATAQPLAARGLGVADEFCVLTAGGSYPLLDHLERLQNQNPARPLLLASDRDAPRPDDMAGYACFHYPTYLELRR